MKLNPAKVAIFAGCLFMAGLIALYVETTTVPIGERPKQFEDLGGDFELNSLNGPINLADYKGQTVVIYFGFLNCAEVCPSSVAVMARAFKRLEAGTYDQTQGFFISVDPQRDDLKSLYDFSQYFDQHILGITGTQEEIDAITDQYGVYVDLVDMEGSVLDYTVDHVSRFFIINPNGDLIDSMSHSTTPVELAAKIERVNQYHAKTKRKI